MPIFKKKGDILECGNYRGITLLEHGLKILERILHKRIRKVVKIDPKQFGFMPGKSRCDIHCQAIGREKDRRKFGSVLQFC